jgi:hypothetical protein
MQMLVVVTVDPEGRLLVLGRIICESETAESYVDLLTAVAGAEGSPAYEMLHCKEMVILSTVVKQLSVVCTVLMHRRVTCK